MIGADDLSGATVGDGGWIVVEDLDGADLAAEGLGDVSDEVEGVLNSGGVTLDNAVVN